VYPVEIFVMMMDLQSDAGSRLNVIVNGEPIATDVRTLADRVCEAGLAAPRGAPGGPGVSGPARARPDRQLAAGDRVEIVSPRQGG